MFPYPFSYMATAESGLAQLDNGFYMEFDGIDDYVDCGNPTELQITGALTISCWVKSSDRNDYVLVAKDDIGSNRSYFLWGNEWGFYQRVQFGIFNGGSATSVSGVTDINDGNWHNVVAVFNPSTSLSIYIDGSLDAQNTTSIPATIDNDPVPFQIGGSVGFYMDGNADEVAVWNSALTALDITEIYNATDLVTDECADLSSMSTPPVAWYRMGD